MDISEKLLSSMDVRVEPFAVCDVSEGCFLDLEADSVCSIHYVLSGQGQLITGCGDSILLQSDQMILIPRGVAQRIEAFKKSTPQGTDTSICLKPSESIKWLTSGAGETEIILACGRIHVTYGQDVDVFSLVDQALVESFDHSDYIRGAFQEILREFCEPKLGTMTLTGALMKQCLILFLRRLHENKDWRIPWLAVLDNRGLQNALRAILDTPERQFRVEDLADIAAMSRSTFTEQFTKSLGQPPHEFLSNFRLRRAAQLLSTTTMSVEGVANRVGYQSRSSFSKAFKGRYGMDPAGYRKERDDAYPIT